VAATLSTKVVALVMEATVAPAGIFGPDTGWPTTRPVVLATVTVVEENEIFELLGTETVWGS
jgi:hypothetical protein